MRTFDRLTYGYLLKKLGNHVNYRFNMLMYAKRTYQFIANNFGDMANEIYPYNTDNLKYQWLIAKNKHDSFLGYMKQNNITADTSL